MTGAQPSTLPSVFSCLWKNKELVVQLTSREIVGRYRGSIFGLLWSFFNPVFMLAVYTFVFSVVFRARWGREVTHPADFALFVFTGMLVHSIFGECINRGPRLVLDNPNYVKKVIFPLEILPWVSMGSALFHMLVSVLVLMLFMLVAGHEFHWTIVLSPVVVAPFVLLTMGLSWWLAGTGVYLRDLGQITGVLTMVLLFMSPVFYPVDSLPEAYRYVFYLNPLTFIIEQFRQVLLWGNAPDWRGLSLYLAFGLACAWAGLYWFQKTRHGFADVV